MILRLTRFELKKIWSDRFFLLALAVLLVLNFALQCGTKFWFEEITPQIEKGVDVGEQYETFWRAMQSRRGVTKALQTMNEPFAEENHEELSAFLAYAKETYGEDVLDNFVFLEDSRLSEPSAFFGGRWSDFDLLSQYTYLSSMTEQTEAARAEVVSSAKGYGREALQDGDSYGVQRNLKVVALYSRSQKEVSGEVRGWNQLVDSPDMLFVCLLILLACAGSVSGEADRKTILLLHTSKNGKAPTVLSKHLAGVVTAVTLVPLFQLVSLAAVWFSGGLCGFSQPVTQLSDLALCPYVLTVGQYLLVTFALHLAAAACLSVLFVSVSSLCGSTVVSYCCSAILLGALLLPNALTPKSEWLCGVLSLLSPTRYFAKYFDANLFGYSVPWLWVQLVLWCAISIASAVLTARVANRQRRAV